MSAWLKRGFQRSVRYRICQEIVLSNAPRDMLIAVVESREAHGLPVDPDLAYSMVKAWWAAARDPLEGKKPKNED